MQTRRHPQTPRYIITNACITQKSNSGFILQSEPRKLNSPLPSSRPHVPRLFHANEWGQYRHINIILCPPLLSLSLRFLSEWMLSTGAYLRRDGKGTEERKSILYLTTKHNPNQKQLEFAGCSINWTASSGWPLCRWIATVMH